MRVPLAVLMLLAFAGSGSAQQGTAPGDGFVGSWQGTLNAGGVPLRLGLEVERGPGGALAATLTSIDQGNARIPATVSVRGDTLAVAIPAVNATYTATLAEDSLRGTFTQMGGSLPLRMARVAAVQTAAPLPYPARLASDAEIRAILARRVDEQKRSLGIVVGIVEPGGQRVVAYGRAGAAGEKPLDGRTVFEIGSVTKTFTALLLADMAARGEVALDDPAQKYLPAGVTMPERGRAITLADLATHTSGLPRLPTNLQPANMDNPYADYTVERLYEFLSGYRLPRDVGASYEYSNLGAGLLGHVLALRAGRDYESLVRERVLEPLGMSSTAIALTPEMSARAADGHDPALQPVPYWDLPTLAGAGALRSTAHDMLAYLAAHLGQAPPALAPAVERVLATRRSADEAGAQGALAWLVQRQDGHELVSHDGGTAGFRSFVGFDRARGVGVVVLSNSGAAEGVNDIGRHLLVGGGPLFEGRSRTAIAMEPAEFDRYVGRYQLVPEFVVAISREGERFYLQATGQPRLLILPESQRDFFVTTVDAQVTFEVDDSGRATAMILRQGGRDQRAVRIE